jgi:hypothetical protein
MTGNERKCKDMKGCESKMKELRGYRRKWKEMEGNKRKWVETDPSDECNFSSNSKYSFWIQITER